MAKKQHAIAKNMVLVAELERQNPQKWITSWFSTYHSQ
jgi:hypothetical protein